MTPRAQAGFTLVELSVVLLVLGLAAGAVALRVQGPLAAGRLDGAVAALEQYDSTVRHWCARHGRQACVLWDMEAGRASLVDANGAALPAAPLRLPEGFKVAEIIVGGSQIAVGNASVAFGTGGMTSFTRC